MCLTVWATNCVGAEVLQEDLTSSFLSWTANDRSRCLIQQETISNQSVLLTPALTTDLSD